MSSAEQQTVHQPWVIVSEKLSEVLKNTRLTICSDLIQFKTVSMNDAINLTKLACKTYPEGANGISMGASRHDNGACLTVRKPEQQTNPIFLEL